MTQVTSANFNEEVLNQDKLVIIDFWATWCGPCKMLSPIIEELDKEMSEVKFCKVNVDEEPELSKEFGVMSIPMLVFISDDTAVETLIGYRTKEELKAKIEEYI